MAVVNEKYYWTVGRTGKHNRWQVRRYDVADSTRFKIIENLGSNIKTAAIEFDGDFVLPSQQEHFIEITEPAPWLFLVDLNGDLLVKRVGQDRTQTTLLASGVTQISACRGFRSEQFGVDMGLCISYLKTDGSAYYRLHEPVAGSITWNVETAIEAAGNGNTSIQAIRLIDFRLGIYVSGCNKFFVSERQYVGNTMKTEYLTGLDVGRFDFVTTPFRDEAIEPTDPVQVSSFRLISSNCFELQCNYPIFDFDPTWDDISLTGNYPADQGIDHVEWRDGKAYIYVLRPITSILTKLSFKLRAFNRKGYYISEQCKPILPELTFGIDPGIISLPTDSVELSARLVNIQPISNTEIVTHNLIFKDADAVQVVTAIQLSTTEIQTHDFTQRDQGSLTVRLPQIVVNTTQVGETPV